MVPTGVMKLNAIDICWTLHPYHSFLMLEYKTMYIVAYIMSGIFMVAGSIFCLRSFILRSTAPLALGLPSYFFGTAVYLLIQIATK